MVSAAKTRTVALADTCRRHRVRRLELFGSAVRDDFDTSESDLDFLVEFESDHPGLAFDDYFGLKEDLEEIFGRAVDLVVASAVRNPYVRAEIEVDRTLLYAA